MSFHSAGQMDAHMIAQQMDPAPSAKAGSDEAGKVWVPKEASMKDVSKETELKAMSEEGPMVSTVFDKDGTGQYVPPSFFDRGSYCMLENQNLHRVPNEVGFTISFHTVSQQWHARWQQDGPETAKHYAPSCGAQRSEVKALCLALIQLWEWYLSLHDDDSDGKAHLGRLKAYSDEILF